MPRRSGIELLGSLREARPGLPVVMMSGGGPGRTLEQATLSADLAGADLFLYKPFGAEELVGAIRSAVAAR